MRAEGGYGRTERRAGSGIMMSDPQRVNKKLKERTKGLKQAVKMATGLFTLNQHIFDKG